jgi:hypothetical protein
MVIALQNGREGGGLSSPAEIFWLVGRARGCVFIHPSVPLRSVPFIYLGSWVVRIVGRSVLAGVLNVKKPPYTLFFDHRFWNAFSFCLACVDGWMCGT